MGTYARALELAAELREAGVPATADAREAPGVLPGVLVPPPRLDLRGYGGAVATWRLAAMARDTVGSETAWRELDGLLAVVAAVLPIELAEPGSYQLGDTSHPAYLLTLTESVTVEV